MLKKGLNKLKRVFDLLKKISKNRYVIGVSYSQNFEDLIINKLLDGANIEKGFFVDVGAHDPIRFSNTYLLHKNGWRGINIDPLFSCIKRFNKMRPNDINLNIGISDRTGEIEYFNFVEPAFNTTNSERALHVLKNGYTKLREKQVIRIDTLKNVFDKYLTNGKIDLLTIDVETMELSVLKSNDWSKYRPKFIIVESIVNESESLDNIYRDSVVNFLINKKYIAVAKVSNACFFKDSL